MDEIKASEARKLLIEIENCLSLSSLNDSEILNMLKFSIKCKLETAKDALDAL